MKKPVIEKLSLNFGKKKRSLARSFTILLCRSHWARLWFCMCVMYVHVQKQNNSMRKAGCGNVKTNREQKDVR